VTELVGALERTMSFSCSASVCDEATLSASSPSSDGVGLSTVWATLRGRSSSLSSLALSSAESYSSGSASYALVDWVASVAKSTYLQIGEEHQRLALDSRAHVAERKALLFEVWKIALGLDRVEHPFGGEAAREAPFGSARA